MPKNMSGIDAKKIRETANISQAAVAAAIGINRAYYGLFEAGRFVLTDLQWSALDKFLHDYLLSSLSPVGAARQPSATADGARCAKHQSNAAPPFSTTADDKSPTPKLPQVEATIMALEQIEAEDKLSERCVPHSIERALSSLRSLHYAALFELSTQRGIALSSIPSPAEFDAFEMPRKPAMKAQLENVILCQVLFGDKWLICDRRALHKIACLLRENHPEDGKIVPFPSILEEIFESRIEADATTARLRIEIAGALVKYAAKGAQTCLTPSAYHS